jgi:hypothetical protein
MDVMIKVIKQFVKLTNLAIKAGGKFSNIAHRKYVYDVSDLRYYRVEVDVGLGADPTVFSFYDTNKTFLASFTTLDSMFEDHPQLLTALRELVGKIIVSARNNELSVIEVMDRFNKTVKVDSRHLRNT